MFRNPMMLTILLSSLTFSLPSWADKHDDHKHQNGHALVQDVHRDGPRIEFEEDQDEVYQAVKRGYIRPFSEMYAAVERDLKGRIIRVELEEDDDMWVYELKINHKNNIIKVEYDAKTLKMLMIKGRDFHQALKKVEE